MNQAVFHLPKPEIKGIGHVWYRCHGEGCGQQVAPEDAVLHPLDPHGELLPETRSYHREHSPGRTPEGYRRWEDVKRSRDGR